MSTYKANDLSGFEFQRTGSGCYKVTYTTPERGDYWVATINDMTLIDETLNAAWATKPAIQHLRNVVKRLGTHYSKDGRKIYKYD